jgi:2'-5' RNA ligase
MRLFIAVPLPSAVVGQVDALVRQVRTQLPAAAWVRPEALHLTLAFLGEQQALLTQQVERAAAERITRATRFEAELRGCGFFPGPTRARVAWIGFEPADALSQLANLVRSALVDEKIAFDEKPFRPHLTLARIRDPWRAEDARLFEAAFAGFRSIEFTVAEAVLYSSQLSSSGAKHSPVARFKLSP